MADLLRRERGEKIGTGRHPLKNGKTYIDTGLVWESKVLQQGGEKSRHTEKELHDLRPRNHLKDDPTSKENLLTANLRVDRAGGRSTGGIGGEHGKFWEGKKTLLRTMI